MKLIKEDIKNIGHTAYKENNNLCICCDIQTANIEEILLRNLLLCFGDYHITGTDEYEENGDITIVYETDLPFNMYMNIDSGC